MSSSRRGTRDYDRQQDYEYNRGQRNRSRGSGYSSDWEDDNPDRSYNGDINARRGSYSREWEDQSNYNQGYNQSQWSGQDLDHDTGNYSTFGRRYNQGQGQNWANDYEDYGNAGGQRQDYGPHGQYRRQGYSQRGQRPGNDYDDRRDYGYSSERQNYSQGRWSGGDYGNRGDYYYGGERPGYQQGQYGQQQSMRMGEYAGRGPKGYQRSDERIGEEVNERLMWHGEVDASDIEVEVKNGIVTLSGTVPDRNQKRMAEDAAENVSGVKDIQNNVRVSRESGEGSRQGNRERGQSSRSSGRQQGSEGNGTTRRNEPQTTSQKSS